MSDGGRISDNPFAPIDAKLTMFALANGVDLAKGEGYRRFEWYAEGRERAILIEAAPDAGFHVGVLSWKTGAVDEAVSAALHQAVPEGDLMPLLVDAVEAANAL